MVTRIKSNRKLEETALVREFLTDHRTMSKLLLHTLVSLEEGNVEEALSAARALDKVGGPHIAFEESELYPRISGENLISETTRQMYDDHHEAVTALKKLLDNPDPDEKTKREIIDGFRTGIHHAEHCGSLISLLAALPEPERNESLTKLLAYRKQGKRWTERIR